MRPRLENFTWEWLICFFLGLCIPAAPIFTKDPASVAKPCAFALVMFFWIAWRWRRTGAAWLLAVLTVVSATGVGLGLGIFFAGRDSLRPFSPLASLMPLITGIGAGYALAQLIPWLGPTTEEPSSKLP